jgi:LAO/AO transport system kinase
LTVRLVDRLLDGGVAALARAISLAEDDAPEAVDVLRRVYPRTGRARVLGVTGAPGSGKSSLVDRLVGVYRKAGCRVGVVAVDPSSAFSGGAILGDRIRMQEHATDPDVFIRSMATRGFLGGLARSSNDAIDLLDAAGYDPILVETVGVGQDEVDIVRTADAPFLIGALVDGQMTTSDVVQGDLSVDLDRLAVNLAGLTFDSNSFLKVDLSLITIGADADSSDEP